MAKCETERLVKREGLSGHEALQFLLQPWITGVVLLIAAVMEEDAVLVAFLAVVQASAGAGR
jgi:hypothetical protein